MQWTHNGETFELLPERALYWRGQQTLIMTDPHFGKGASMRQQGVAVPAGSTRADIERLGEILERRGAKRLLMLGDFFHAKSSVEAQTVETLSEFFEVDSSLEKILVRGNHDRRAGDPPTDFGITCVEEPCIWKGFAFCHFPQAVDGHYCFAGHVHPGVVLRDRDGSKARMACFWFGKQMAVLPAFGSFTGLKEIEPGKDDRIYVVPQATMHSRDEVIEVGKNPSLNHL